MVLFIGKDMIRTRRKAVGGKAPLQPSPISRAGLSYRPCGRVRLETAD